MTKPIGVFTRFGALTETEREIVQQAWKGANNAADYKLSYQSDFPVGAGILAANEKGERKVFFGANVENNFYPAGICAERSAATTAATEGFTNFECVALLCRKQPGGSPCGMCRQVLIQFGRKAVFLCVVDHDSNVRRVIINDLLPQAKGTSVPFAKLSEEEKDMVTSVMSLKNRAYVPYSKRARAALFIASDEHGEERTFRGVSDDNSAYGASALAEAVAMRTARTEGHAFKVKLMVTVEDPRVENPVDGECLQILREFGADSPVLLVAEDRSVITSHLEELLPDSFGPEALSGVLGLAGQTSH
jgi:homotetrameric cytidine deaminase